MLRLIRKLWGFNDYSDYEDSSQIKFKQKGEFSQKQTILNFFVKHGASKFWTNKDLCVNKVLGENIPIKSYTRAVNDLINEGKLYRTTMKSYDHNTKKTSTLIALRNE